MGKDKSNIDNLRDILSELKSKPISIDAYNNRVKEAGNLLTAINEDLNNKDTQIRASDMQLDELQDKLDVAPELTNSDFLGLDTLHWSLESGNLILTEKIETFISQLKKENGAGE